MRNNLAAAKRAPDETDLTGGDLVKVGALKETFPGEARVAMTPASALELKKLGHEALVEAGAGAAAGISDAAYQAAGVTVLADAAALMAAADVIAKVRPPTEAETAALRAGQTQIGRAHV